MKNLILFASLMLFGCEETKAEPPVSTSGVQKMTVHVDTNAAGHSVEQENIARRYKMDNTPGSVKWLYIISPMSGDVLLASSVQGKVTSSGKRLTPKSVSAGEGYGNGMYGYGQRVTIANETYRTSEVIQDDGTYGDSGEYLYWWDQRDQYHQQYITVGVMVHVSDKPMHWPKVIMNMDAVMAEK